MIEEIQAIEKNQSCEPIDLPEGVNFIGLKWISKTKYNLMEVSKVIKLHLLQRDTFNNKGSSLMRSSHQYLALKRLELHSLGCLTWLAYVPI